MEITDLDILLKDVLGSTKKIKNTNITRLTAPGDNYGSLMLKLDVLLQNEQNGKEETLALVAKKIPTSVVYQEVFNIQVTFKKEVELYRTVVPILENFVNRELKFFPKYYAARYNLTDSDIIDGDGVLVLENLVLSGYSNLDRKLGFDLENSKVLLENLAEFHAVSLAFRLKHPSKFEEKIKKFCPMAVFTSASDRYNTFNAYSDTLMSEYKKCAHLQGKLRFLNPNNRVAVSDIYGTLVHFDLWTNNIMVKLKEGKLIGTKFVDFQVYTYGSPASDLLMFFLTSLQDNVLKENVDELIVHYHQHFLKNLKELDCSTESYTLDSLLNELRIHSKFEFGHAFFFVTFHLNSDRTEEDLNKRDPNSIITTVTQRAKEKAWLITLECEKRGWLPKVDELDH